MKKRHEIVKLMSNIDNLHLVNTAHKQITELYANYQQSYIAHYDLLGTETEQDEESKRYVTAWIYRAEVPYPINWLLLKIQFEIQ